jgi:hypothetical protein
MLELDEARVTARFGAWLIGAPGGGRLGIDDRRVLTGDFG